MDSVRDELLFEVDMIQKIGIPGRIVVFGPNAVAIATGKHEEDVILAAGVLGKGRVCAFSHGGYGKQLCDPYGVDHPNSTLYRNVRSWIAGRELTDDFKALKLDESKPQRLEELRKYDFVVSLSARVTTPVKVVEDYVAGGGGMVFATTPWGWLQLNHGKKAYEIPYGQILMDVGIGYSKEYSDDHGSGFAVELNRAEEAHAEQYLSRHRNNVDKLIDKVNLISQVMELPPHLQGKFKKDLQAIWKPVNDKVVKTFRSGKIKVRTKNERNLLDMWLLCAEMQPVKDFKAFGIDDFPGDFSVPPVLVQQSVTFACSREDYFFTSCYLPAGRTAKLTVSKLTGSWRVYVGAHTDTLCGIELNRWPKITSTFEATKPGTLDLTSPFGGSIILRSPKGEHTIEAHLSDVVPCPRFELPSSKKKESPWKESRNNSGLWADMSGKYMTIVLPSSSVRKIDDPGPAMELYDKLLMAYHDLRGTAIDKAQKMWIVADVQPSCGYMHAGYPIVTHLDVADPNKPEFLLNAATMRTSGSWGIFHEIGHNMQQTEWTFSGTGEVTVNVFTLYGMYVLGGLDPWTHPWLKKQTAGAINYLKGGAQFQKWKTLPGEALYFYAQLVHSFRWDAYKRVFRRYQSLNPQKKPKSDQDKIDLWFLIFSEEVKFNLAPIGTFWGIPISDGGLARLSALNLKPFLPDDEITREAPDRVTLAKEHFPALVRSP